MITTDSVIEARLPRLDNSWRLTFVHLSILLAISLLCCWPLLVHGLPDLGHDSISHVSWQKSFSTQLWHGELYPRWLSDQNKGLGSPTYYFYPPVPSYAASLFSFTMKLDPSGWLQAGYGCALAIALSAFTAYFWLRYLAEPRAALFGATIYLIAPYHLAVDLYTRGAVAELWAFVWLPLILLLTERLLRKQRWAFSCLAVIYAVLVMTHLPTVVCFSPVILAYAFFFSSPGKGGKNVLTTMGSLALGTGLSAIYLLPAMLDKSKVHIGSWVVDFYDYRKYWIFHKVTWPPDLEVRILFLNLSTLAFIAGLFWLVRRDETRPFQRQIATFYLAIALLAFFFMSQLSAPLWRLVPFLKFVVFPWRFSTLITLSAAAISAICFCHLKNKRALFVTVPLIFIAIAWIGVGRWTAMRGYLIWHRNPEPWMIGYREQSRSLTDICEFWPADAASDKTCIENPVDRSRLLDTVLDGHPAKSVILDSPSAVKDSDIVSVIDWQPRRIALNVNTSQQEEVTLRHFYYSGWLGYIEGKNETVTVIPSRPDGFLQFAVPQGNYKLILVLKNQASERWGTTISGVFVLLLLCVLILEARPQSQLI